jgi:hypothetical protein
VRPNNGVLPPGETIEVQVLLNYVKDAPPNLDTRDKFQIQSIVLAGPLGNVTDIGEVWAKATAEQIIKQKLKSRFTAARPIPPPTAAGTTSETLTNPPINPTQSSIQSSIQSTTTPSSTQEESTQTTQSPASLNSSQQTTPSLSQNVPPSPSIIDKKDSLGDSTDQHQFFSPSITATSSQDTKQSKEIPKEQLDHKPQAESKGEAQVEPERDTIKPTGDYVMDSVAVHSQLRKSLEQVAQLKSERENYIKDSQRLNEQVKTLTELLTRAKEEQVQTGLRQRTPHNTTPGSPTLSHQPQTSHIQQQNVIQIQTNVLLFVILFFSVIAFFLGRFSR